MMVSFRPAVPESEAFGEGNPPTLTRSACRRGGLPGSGAAARHPGPVAPDRLRRRAAQIAWPPVERSVMRTAVSYTHLDVYKRQLKLYCTDPEHEDFQTVVQDVYLGPVPYMTPSGSFIINGAERVIVTPVSYTHLDVYKRQNLGSTDSTTLTIKVIPNTVVGNDNPIAQHDTSFTEEGVSVSSTVLNNDSDPDGDALTVTSATGLTIGTATVVSGVNAAGTPVANAGTVQLLSLIHI